MYMYGGNLKNFYKNLLLFIVFVIMEQCEVTANIVFLQLKNSFSQNLAQKVISYFDFEDLKTLS